MTESDIVRRAGAGTGCLAAALLTGLLKVSIGANLFHDSFFIHDLFKASHCLIDRLATSDFNLGHLYCHLPFVIRIPVQ